MQVELKMDDVNIVLGNNGIVLKIYDNADRHVGDLRIGRATVNWMHGRTREANGNKIPMAVFIDMLEQA
jgi:hypothetical protein